MIWDNHACLPMEPHANLRFLPQIERYRRAGVDVVSLNAGYGEMSLEEHLGLLRQMRSWLLANTERYLLIETVADVELARASGRLGVTFDVEGAAPFAQAAQSLDASLDLLCELGVRWILLAYNRSNPFGGGCHDTDDPGLSAAGAALIAAMERAGIVTCLSHVGYRTARDALGHGSRPMIFSHSNPRALQDHPRNLPDELIRLCAARGGVVGVNGLGLFLGNEGSTAQRAADHVDYIVQLTGPEHVGLGLDYVFDMAGLEEEKASMASSFPRGMGYEKPTTCLPPEAIPDIAAILRARGYDDAALSAVLGGNWLRIAKQCWRASAGRVLRRQ